MNITQIIKALKTDCGVSGNESKVSEAAASLLSLYSESVSVDSMGNVIAHIKNGSPHILLDAHIDRIGFIITDVYNDGFLRFAPVGGVDKRALPAQIVSIYTKSGIIKGVITSMPPHLQNTEQMSKTAEFDDLFIDTGLENACEIIFQGDFAVVDSSLIEYENGRICSSALDDRAGAASIIKALEITDIDKLSCGITVLFSAQEETGERGAIAASGKINYDEVIAVDVSFAHTPDAAKYKCGEISGGVMIGTAPSITSDISDKFIEIARRKNIKYSVEVMSGSTGTNMDALSTACKGARSALLSIPLRYMHTPCELIDTADVECVSKLLSEYLLEAGE